MTAKKVVIAGGSGFLGRSLARFLTERGDTVTVVSRSKPEGPWGFERWDGRTVGEWKSTLDGADALVNLAGRSVDCVKTPDHRDEILRSRVESTLALGEAMRQIESPPPVWVQMSTAHIYGDSQTVECDESSATGYGFAPDIGRAWESAFERAKPDHTRGVVLRTSFVVAMKGGAMDRLAPLARLGLGGEVGSGKQGMSWIHHRDMNRVMARAVDDESMHGVYVVSSPNPVCNRDFMIALRKAVGAPFGLPAPAPLVRLAAPFLRTDPELALYGRYVVPTRLLAEGFEFEFPSIDGALTDLFG